MSILDWGLSDEDISAARKVLQDDEQLVLAIKPRAEHDCRSDWLRWIVVALASVILVGLMLLLLLLSHFSCVRPCASP